MLRNLPRVRAQRVLDMSKAIGLAMGGDPRTTGELMVLSGESVRSVGKWVQTQERAIREHHAAKNRGLT